jgi:hypothetical protein
VAALSCRFFIFWFAVATATRFLATMMHGIHSSPGTSLGFFLRKATLFVSFFYVLRFSLLFVGVFLFVTSRHDYLLVDA